YHPNLGLLAPSVSTDEIEDTPEFRLPDGRTLRRTFRNVRRHVSEQYNDVELIYYLDGQRIVQAFPMRYFFRYEVEHLLARCGFRVAALYGDFDKSEFGDESREMIFTAGGADDRFVSSASRKEKESSPADDTNRSSAPP